MDERVLNVVELIVRTEGECVVAEIPRQVVFERVNALVERVCAAGKFRADIDFRIRLAVGAGYVGDLYGRALIRHFAVVLNDACAGAEFVVERVSDVAVELGYERVRFVGDAICRIVEEECLRVDAIRVAVSLVILIAEREFVRFVDIPVQTAQETVASTVHIALAKAFADAGKCKVAISDLLCRGSRDVFVRITGVNA